MLDALAEPFRYGFVVDAVVAGVLAAVATAVVGTWVVLRGMSFIGDALAHGVLPGLAVASLAGWPLALGALVSALIMSAAITLVNRRTKLGDDVGIGLLFVGMLALGVLIISSSRSYAGDLTSFLFGNVLGVGGADLAVQAVAAVAVVAGSVLGYRAFFALAFHPDKAAALGLRPGRAHAALLVLVTVAVVASFTTVGTLLVFGLLVAPPATAALLVRRVPAMMAVSALLGVVAVLVGVEVSWHWELATGATMAAVSVALFFLVLAGRGVADRLVRSRHATPLAA